MMRTLMRVLARRLSRGRSVGGVRDAAPAGDRVRRFEVEWSLLAATYTA
jgi:hypothetical protein